MVSKFILILFKAFVACVREYLEYVEKVSDKDADGFPVDSDYERIHFVYEFLLDSYHNLQSEFADFDTSLYDASTKD